MGWRRFAPLDVRSTQGAVVESCRREVEKLGPCWEIRSSLARVLMSLELAVVFPLYVDRGFCSPVLHDGVWFLPAFLSGPFWKPK